MWEIEINVRGNGTVGIRGLKGLIVIKNVEWGTWRGYVLGSKGTLLNGRCNTELVFLMGWTKLM